MALLLRQRTTMKVPFQCKGAFVVALLPKWCGCSLALTTIYAWLQTLLEACGRSHNLDDVHRAVEAVHAAQPPSWSLDLITGLPGLSAASWSHSLAEAVRAEPPHVSVYDLQVLCSLCSVSCINLSHVRRAPA